MARRAMKRAHAIGCTVVCLLPEAAWAHGQEILLLPFGQLIALVAAGVIAWRVCRWAVLRCAVFLAAIAVALVTWTLPKAVEDALVGRQPSEGRLFLLGLAPAIVAGVIALLWRSFSREDRT